MVPISRMRFSESSSWAERMTRSSMVSLRCLRGARFSPRAQMGMNCGRGIAAIADGPDNERGAARDIAARKHAFEVCHQRSGIGFERAPARHGKLRRAKLRRQIFRIEAQCHNCEI